MAELREDLARDEEIFAAKQQELRNAQHQLEAAQSDIAKLRGMLEESEKQREEAQRRMQEQDQAAPTAHEKEVIGDRLAVQGSRIFEGKEGRAHDDGHDDGLTVTSQQRANRAMASVVDEDDLVQVRVPGDPTSTPCTIMPLSGQSVFRFLINPFHDDDPVKLIVSGSLSSL